MTKQEADKYMSERGKQYREFGTFKMAIHGPGDVLKELQKREVFKDSELMDDEVLLLNDIMNYAIEILDWYDFAAELPELEIVVTGAAISIISGEPGTYSTAIPIRIESNQQRKTRRQ